jgi:Ca2+-binding EF-hand superfamily protein
MSFGRVLLVAACVAGLSIGFAVAQSTGQAAKVDPRVVEADAQDLIFVGGKQPVIVRWHVQVNGKGLQSLPVPEGLPSVFNLTSGARKAGQLLDLFSLLDLNRDGELSADEFGQMEVVLHKFDLDDDETLALDELLLDRVPAAAAQPEAAKASPTEVPFLRLGSDEAATAAAQQLINRFGRAAADHAARSLGPAELGWDAAAIRAADADGDGSLAAAELAELCKNPPVQVELLVQFGSRFPRPQVAVLRGEVRKLPAAVVSKSVSTSSPTAVIIGSALAELRAVSHRSQSQDAVSLALISFLQADADKNMYLDMNEFAAVQQLQGADFKAVDANGDGMVLRDEVTAYIRMQTSKNQNRIDVSFVEEGKSLFELLDGVPMDRRLTRRECRAAWERLKVRDTNGNGRVSAEELAGTFRLTIEFGRLPGFGAEPMPNTATGNTAPIVNRPTAGPEWFQKMDRNRDGDLSTREFLGAIATFRKLDADGDGLISADEANQAK